MTVRRSVAADAEAVAQVLRRSITELCRADHHDDQDDLERWLANKTPAAVAGWIEQPDAFCATAEAVDGAIAGFGMLLRPGVLSLLYVSPDHIGTGHGRDLLQALEQQAGEWGLKQISLQSTAAAVGFYQACGYRRIEHIVCRADGLTCYAMYKRLLD